MTTIDTIIDGVLQREAGYANDPNDPGGETMHGITIAVARECGYTGAMRDLPIETARDIYRAQYVTRPRFHQIVELNDIIGAKLVDTGVNMGPAVAAKFLQRALNAFNHGPRYPDLTVDGKIGPATIEAMDGYLRWRGKAGVRTLLAALNGLQAARYIEITEARPTQRKFAYGWISQRVAA